MGNSQTIAAPTFLAIHTAIEDLLRSGITDFSTEEAFNFSAHHIEKDAYQQKGLVSASPRLDGTIHSNVHTQTHQASSIQTQKQHLATNAALAQMAAPKVIEKPFIVDDFFWVSGQSDAAIQVIISSDSQARKGDAPLSHAGEKLFTKMLESIGISHEKIGFITLKAFDDSGQPHIEKNTLALKGSIEPLINMPHTKHILLVGQDCARILFEKETLHSLRKKEITFANKPVSTVMHPEALLKQPLLKRMAWADLLKFKSTVGDY